ncbi:MAG: diphosphomevalonate decarboxylase [Anaerolineales bacterium]
MKSSAAAHPNIAFIKYWGNLDHDLRLPANGSISMTLGGLQTRTTVEFDPDLSQDSFILDGAQAAQESLRRVSQQLDLIRSLAGFPYKARVQSENSFPAGTGIASSASGFAALTVAACAAAELELPPKELSRLARRASGSASRSIFGGFVEWHKASTDEGSYAEQLAPADHWSLVDWVAVVDEEEKEVGSSQGHRLADTSPLQEARISSAAGRLTATRQAILSQDFATLARFAELDSDMMHAVMMTSNPPLHYWRPTTVEVMQRIRRLRSQGIPVFYTLDAGPNPHCLCPEDRAEIVQEALLKIPGVRRLLRAEPGGPARVLSEAD